MATRGLMSSGNYGLKNSGNDAPVPLKKITVQADIEGFFAHVGTTFVYENEEEDPIEASFVFPLDERSAVYKFEAVIEGRLIVGEVQTKDQAEQTYADAIEAGESAFLMKEDDEAGDVFECKVGNLPPKTQVEITFAFAQELEFTKDGCVQFVYPCILPNRCTITPDDEDGAGPSTPIRKKVKGREVIHAKEVPYSASVTINVQPPPNSSKVVKKMIYNKEHYHGQGGGQTLSMKDLKFDEDLVVSIVYSDAFEPHMIVERGRQDLDGLLKEDVALVEFHPSIPGCEDRPPSSRAEYIFIIDRSGSMAGDRISSARHALKAFLQHLPDDCYFNIVSFGSGYTMLFGSGSVLKSEESMKRAFRLQEEMDADMGCTEMLRPFKAIYRQTTKPNYPRKIILLTDGSIYGEQDLFSLISKSRRTCQVYAIGIGFGASTSLIRGVARAGCGKALFLREDNKTLKDKVVRVLQWACQPVYTDVALSWQLPGSATAVPIPQDLQSIIIGESFVAYAVLRDLPKNNKQPLEISCTLSFKHNWRTISHELSATIPPGKAVASNVRNSLPVHRIAAKAQIKELQDNEEHDGRNKDPIVLVSLAANIISRYTSFIGVDKGRVDKVTGQMQRRNVPLAEERPTLLSQPLKRPAPTPRFYGGAPSDCGLSERYVDGKEACTLPSRDEEMMEVMDLPKKRKVASEVKELCTAQCVFAQWYDGNYYPGKLFQSPENSLMVEFCDGLVRPSVPTSLISPGQLRAADQLLASLPGHHEYQWAMLLEYCGDDDSFVVVLQDGRVLKVNISMLAIEKDLAQQAQGRTKNTDLGSEQLCGFEGLDGQHHSIETCDLAELRSDGWINQIIVEFCVQQQWKVLSKATHRDAFCFSPAFYGELSQDIPEFIARSLPKCPQKRCYALRSQSAREQRFERVIHWAKDINMRHKKALFVPIFDETHWYLVYITLTLRKQTVHADFSVMDSYFDSGRQYETTLLAHFLCDLCSKQGLQFACNDSVRCLPVPIQATLSDCGTCMLLCLQKTLQENLRPKPHLDWFSPAEIHTLRLKLSCDIIKRLRQQSNGSSDHMDRSCDLTV